MKRHLLYSPEKNDVYVSTDVVFHPNHAYDGFYNDQHELDMITSTKVPAYSIEQYKYLKVTNHIDPNDDYFTK